MESKRKVLILNGEQWDKQDLEEKIKTLKIQVNEGNDFSDEEKSLLLDAIQRIENEECENCDVINNKEATDKLILEIAHNNVDIIIAKDAKTFNKIGKDRNQPGLIAAECSVYSLDGKINTISKENKFKYKAAVYLRMFQEENIKKNNKKYKKILCEICKKDMITSHGCSVDTISIDGKIYGRVKFGDEYENLKDEKTEEHRCRDCGVKIGEYHHWKCGIEKCPVCNEQLIGCNCKEVWVEEFDSEAEAIKYEKIRKEINKIKKQIADLEEQSKTEDEQREEIEIFLASEKNRTKNR